MSEPQIMKDGIKHLINCKCILPQFKNYDPPVFHKFVVFSELDENGNVITDYAQCNNCGVIHKVTEIGISTVLKKESLPSILTIEEYKCMLPPKLVGFLETNECDYATWKEAYFIISNKLWGRGFVLNKESVFDPNTMTENVKGKYIRIISDNLYEIKAFERDT